VLSRLHLLAGQAGIHRQQAVGAEEGRVGRAGVLLGHPPGEAGGVVDEHDLWPGRAAGDRAVRCGNDDQGAGTNWGGGGGNVGVGGVMPSASHAAQTRACCGRPFVSA
jgi:hypothetical protein